MCLFNFTADSKKQHKGSESGEGDSVSALPERRMLGNLICKISEITARQGREERQRQTEEDRHNQRLNRQTDRQADSQTDRVAY